MDTCSSNPGALIRLGRAVRRLSQRELAQAAGLTMMRVWRIEAGVATPRADEIHRLAVALDLDPVTRTLVRELAATVRAFGTSAMIAAEAVVRVRLRRKEHALEKPFSRRASLQLDAALLAKESRTARARPRAVRDGVNL